ncbi:MAG: CDP-glycerol glycerophosphotransferase family protein, partial [Patescibacteria group bacterium]|nr:CDP-glycerol glycerophosphotransferase family protein [Patescibacteria group bacterium]
LRSTNEFFFLKSVLEILHKNKGLMVFMSHGRFTEQSRLYYSLRNLIKSAFSRQTPALVSLFWKNSFNYLDFYINATLSYDIEAPKNARHKIHFPHVITPKTKHDVFSPVIEQMTDIFMTGNIYARDLSDYCHDKNIKKIPSLHKIGSPKSDYLFNKKVNRGEFLKNIGLDPNLPTVFYAPTWNQEASIPTWLEHILEIPDKYKVNLIIKIHPGAYINPKSKRFSGGVDWKTFFEAEHLRKKRIYNALNEDSAEFVMVSDIAITDISTIWIEFYLLRKDIIFLDIPDFFKKYEKNSLGEFRDTYGYLVKDVYEMNGLIEAILNKTFAKKTPPFLDNELIYNKGEAAQAAFNVIEKLYKAYAS